MVAAVAHEVRHPIFALQASAYVLRDRLTDRPDVAAPLKTLDAQTQRLDLLMRDLLDFARPNALQRAPTSVAELVEETVSTFRGERAQCPPVALELDGGLPPIAADRFRLGQALLNLLHNAATHARGLTGITVRAHRQDNGAGDGVRISVADDGVGVPTTLRARIFDPFVTSGAGAGLGLAIVRRILRAHGGEVHVEPGALRGTVFHLDLPAQ
jgi:signal transduction histidine kinase